MSEREYIKELAAILGVPGECVELHFSVRADAVIEVLCRYYPSVEQMDRVEEVLKKFELVPKAVITER